MPHRLVSSLPTGTSLSRFIMAKAMARGDSMAAQMISEGWVDVPTVRATLALEAKASISPATTTDATFAGPLASYGLAAEALQLERGISIVGQLAPRMRRVPFHTRVPVETGAGTSGGWVAEGTSAAVRATAYATLSQEAYKAQTIVVMSKELLQVGNPDAELTIRTTTMAGVAAFLDSQFLTPTVALVAQKNPASVTNGAGTVASTGSTSAAIAADLAAMLALVSTSGQGLTWIM
ncbi:MAG: hypothetical protein H0W08_24310, partial [Acidobacteria bacterium]|nr:hypothetical protein [Acidobacteriota bacterium]